MAISKPSLYSVLTFVVVLRLPLPHSLFIKFDFAVSLIFDFIISVVHLSKMFPNFKLLLTVAVIGLVSLLPFEEDIPAATYDQASKMELLKKISRNILLNYASKEEVAFETLWQDRACVITFLRRFG